MKHNWIVHFNRANLIICDVSNMSVLAPLTVCETGLLIVTGRHWKGQQIKSILLKKKLVSIFNYLCVCVLQKLSSESWSEIEILCYSSIPTNNVVKIHVPFKMVKSHTWVHWNLNIFPYVEGKGTSKITVVDRLQVFLKKQRDTWTSVRHTKCESRISVISTPHCFPFLDRELLLGGLMPSSSKP